MSAAGIEVMEMRHDSWIAPRWMPLARRGFRSLALGTAVKGWLRSLEGEVDVLLVFGSDFRFLYPARRWARKKGTPVVVDIVDWYERTEGHSFTERLFITINNRWTMPRIVPRLAGAVTVSRWLSEYFEKRGLQTLRVPAVISPPEDEAPLSPGSASIVYAGAPGRRDHWTVDNLRQLARDPGRDLPEVAVHLVGPPPMMTDDGLHSRVSLVEHGRVAREEAVAIVARADFTTLQRPAQATYARAGFPSKIAESLLAGVPVVANLSSDLSEYLSDGVNSVIIADETYGALRDGLIAAARWKESGARPDRARIARDARAHFAPTAVGPRLEEFLAEITRRNHR
jgi:glycosyltransferase involved in cell wall biosynthesis